MALDLPTVLHARALLNRTLRNFFAERAVLEVETPLLSVAGTTDPAIESLVAHDPLQQEPARWLRTSPEFFHKRLLSAGSGPIFELGRVFRAGESSARHNPEFSLLEWYRPGFGEAELMDEVEALIRSCALAFGRTCPAMPRSTFAALYRQHTGFDPHLASEAQLTAAVAALGLVGHVDRDGALDLLRTHLIEPALDPAGACFVTDFPASQAALARLKPGEPAVAARFELYLGGLELANGYHELADADEQRSRFAADLARRSAARQPAVPIDQHFLQALACGIPDCSGVALGVDRLLMWLLDAPRIDQVLPFPWSLA